MTDNITTLIAEARGRTYTPSRPALLITLLADALEAEHKRADSVQFALDGFRSVAARDNAYLIERAERAEAERDRYRAAIQDAYNAWHMESRQAAIDILARALNENGAG